MTIDKWGQFFDILQDKYGSPYHTDSEKTLFFNRAILDFVGQFLPADGESGNLELSEDATSQIATLIYDLPYTTMDSSGIVTKATIQTALNGQIAGGLLWRRLNIGWVLGGDTLPAKWTRHNDWYQFMRNVFKVPSVSNPRFYETATKYQFSPIQTTAKLYFTVLKYPVSVVLDSVTPANNINCDLPDFTHNKIIALALEYAGIGSRDENLAQLLQLKNK